MKILITGAAGFSASFLTPLLRKEKRNRLVFSDMVSVDRNSWHKAVLTDFTCVYKLIKNTKPDQIYHMAATFSNNYQQDYKSNVLAAKNILDSISKARLKCRVLLIGSCAEYGSVPEADNPVKEDYPLRPVSIYGLTKACQTLLMKFYVSVYGMDIVMARVFNLLGKGMSGRLFVGRLYEQIEQYKKGSISKITVENLRAIRDYIDIKEAVRHYKLIMDHGEKGQIYNVGSGKPVRMRDLLKSVLKENGVPINAVRQSPHYYAKSGKIDIDVIYADTGKLASLSRSAQKHKRG